MDQHRTTAVVVGRATHLSVVGDIVTPLDVAIGTGFADLDAFVVVLATDEQAAAHARRSWGRYPSVEVVEVEDGDDDTVIGAWLAGADLPDDQPIVILSAERQPRRAA